VGASTLEALEEAVQKYKVLAKTVAPHSEQAKNIIRRLVQLRMKLFEAKVCDMETFFYHCCPFSGPPRNCFRHICLPTYVCILYCTATTTPAKSSPYSTADRMVLELIPVLGSQPAGDVTHKPGSRLPLLFARPAVTLTTFKRAATNFAAW